MQGGREADEVGEPKNKILHTRTQKPPCNIYFLVRDSSYKRLLKLTQLEPFLCPFKRRPFYPHCAKHLWLRRFPIFSPSPIPANTQSPIGGVNLDVVTQS